MPKSDLFIFYGALVVAGCLMVFGIVSYPSSSGIAAGAAADVQAARYIDRNH